MTARLALDALAVPPGGTIAVTGAAGAVGGYAVELAKAGQLTVIADATPHDAHRVRGFGADNVVERGPEVAARIRALAPEGVAGLVDGSLQTTEITPAVADGGPLAELRGWPGPAAWSVVWFFCLVGSRHWWCAVGPLAAGMPPVVPSNGVPPLRRPGRTACCCETLPRLSAGRPAHRRCAARPRSLIWGVVLRRWRSSGRSATTCSSCLLSAVCCLLSAVCCALCAVVRRCACRGVDGSGIRSARRCRRFVCFSAGNRKLTTFGGERPCRNSVLSW
ncbi:hypothetical protein [Streptomyces noursei]|uniref:hypothetical protein n=1 Tax=Streptomyces noursei TaxID=1971 RepID=UPI001F048417|nr:hypothetical protein [Streptomyces noursei]